MTIRSQDIENLSPKKRALFEMLLKERARAAAPAQQIKPRGDSGPAPLTLAQERVWLLDQLEPGSAQYNNAAAIRFSGPLDVAALEKSIGEVIRRHENLRTTFALVDSRPRQFVAPAAPYALPFVDLSGLPEAGREAEVARLSAEEAARPFDLARGPLMRLTLLKAGDEQYVILLTMHHIITDGLSVAVLIREMTALYAAHVEGSGAAAAPLPPLPVQYADYAAWQREWLEGEAAEEQLKYWRRRLEGAPPLELPTDRPRPAVQSFDGATYAFALPGGLGDELKALSRGNGATLFMTLLAGFQVLLARYSRQEDILTGTLVNNRNRPELENLTGYFINTLVLRTNLSGDPTFKELLARVREGALAAYARQDLPFERLADTMQSKRDPSRGQLFQVMFNLINLSIPAMKFAGLESSDVAMSRTEVESGSAKFDLSLEIEDGGEGLKCWLVYNTDLFDEETVARMAAHFRGLLEGVVADPQRRISDLPMSGEDSQQRMPAGREGAAEDFRLDVSFHELFEAQAERTPTAAAVSEGDEEWSYRELNERANRGGRALAERGVGPETVVGLYAHRDRDFLTAVLSVFKAGGAYLPLDPSYPAKRLRQVLEQSRCAFIVAADDLAEGLAEALEGLPAGERPTVLSFGETQAGAAPAGNLPARSGPDNLAYVIFTSGSTGVPKGAMVEQRGMLNHLFVKVEDLRLTGADVLAQTASQFFDISVWQFLAPLLVGGRVRIVGDEVTHDPWRLLEEVESRGVTVLETVPSMLRAMLSEIELTGGMGLDLSSLRWMIATGEALPPDLCRRWVSAYAEIPLLNAYGPTECSDDVTHYVVESAPGEDVALVPIGTAVKNMRLYVLDRKLRFVPVGVAGELCVGGVGVGRGYLNDPARTALAFVPHPFSEEPGARLYRTGDLARFLRDGNIEYLGRLDHQVKIRGFRIELGEIEAVLSAHDAVREAVVLAREDVPGDKRLVAYVVAVAGGAPAGGELRQYVRERLPEYMVPSAVVALDAMPLTANGKVDRQALPAPEASDDPEVRENFVAPRTPVEEVLAGIWAEALALKRVGVTDDFFKLGGHSLLIMQIISRAREAFGVELSLREMFENPTVAALAGSIERAIRGEHGAAAPPIKPVARGAALPLSFAQHRLWFLDQLSPGNHTYNIPAALGLEGRLDVGVLERSLDEIVRRHEALRTTFESADGEPVQVVREAAPLELTVTDLRALPEREREAEAKRLIVKEGQTLFDLARGPLVRAGLLRLGDESYVLLLTLHHIITDGWSGGVLLRELTALYEAFSKGQPSPLPPLPVQYADYAAWQQEWLRGEVLDRHLGYWKRQLEGAPALLELPTDRPRPAVRTFRGGRLAVTLPAELSERLRELSRREGVTLFMLLLAAFKVLLARYSGQSDVLVGVPVANRQRPELENLIGLFANLLVLRTEVSGGLPFKQLLQRVREAALGAYTHQEMPFEKLVAALNLERSMSYDPLVQVVLALHNAPAPNSAAVEGLKFSVPRDYMEASRLDLILDLVDAEGGLTGTLEYNRDLFDEQTVARLLDSFRLLLGSAAEHPERNVSELELLPEGERATLLAQWGRAATGGEAPRQSLPQLFEAQVGRTPHATALTFEGESLTYGELNERANRLAHHLRAKGVGPEVPVALCLERGVELVVAILGVLKAGGAYVPLDPQYPKERLAFMLADAGTPVLVTQQSLLSLLPAHRAQAVLIDAEWDEIAAAGGADNPAPLAGPEHVAYVIYTSGSTGRPKGTLVTHANVTRLFDATREDFKFGAEDVWTLFHSYAFDFSVWELWGALLYGGRLVVVPYWVSRSPGGFYTLLRREGVTVLNQTPSAFRQLMRAEEEAPEESGALSLRLVIFGGEALETQTLKGWFARHGDERPLLVNMYGITETTVHVTRRALRSSDAAQGVGSVIGAPLDDLEVYVLDGRQELLPVGVWGELYVGGGGVARNYLNRPGLTAERFIPDPFGGRPGARLYRTGDVGRYLAGGGLEYKGRADAQVKVRGYRIELGEIEAALSAHEQVREAVVLSREDEPGEKRLVAYVVAGRDESRPTGQELRGFLKERLPDYMIPSAFVTLAELPLTTNGKVDRKALPAPDGSRADGEGAFVGAGNPVEDVLASIWSEVLHLSRVGVNENFFDLGGHSLIATRLISHLRDAFRVEISLRTLFEHPTVAGLARRIEAALRSEEAGDVTPLAPVPREDGLPLSFAQKRLWLEDRSRPGRAGLNSPVLLRYDRALDPARLEQCLNEVVARHEALRTVFVERGGQPAQHILPRVNVALPVVDLREGAREERTRRALELAREEGSRPFDLGRGPLLRAKLLRLDEEEYWLLLLMHHIVVDPWSLSVLLRELAALYAGREAGEGAALPALPVQYADYAVWQQRWLESEAAPRQLDYWKRQLAGGLTPLELPTDRPRAEARGDAGASHPFEPSARLSDELKALSRREGVTLFMTLFTAFNALLHLQTGREEILLSTPTAARPRRELEHLVGFFANLVLLRSDLRGDPTWREMLRRTRETVIEAYTHDTLPVEMVLDALREGRGVNVDELTRVSFGLLSTPSMEREGPGPVPQPVFVEVGEADHDLSLRLWEQDGRLVGRLVYRTELFTPESARRMAEQYEWLLEAMIDRPEQTLSGLSASARVAV